jgi:hypothetical protein
MEHRSTALRAGALSACLLVSATACASSKNDSSRSSTTNASSAHVTSTTNYLESPNEIPFEVGAKVGLPNGWTVRIARVHRHFSHARLPAAAAGHEYVALDIEMDNEGSNTETVKASELLTMGDDTGKVDPIVAAPNGLDGSYPPGTDRSGQVVFEVPAQARLRMAMEGPLIGTKKTIFTVVPPTVPTE